MECEIEVIAAEACRNYDIVHSIEENGTGMTGHRSADKSYSKMGECFV